MQLGACVLEVDMSIVDRITTLLNTPAFLSVPSHKSHFSNMYQVRLVPVFQSSRRQQTSERVSSTCPRTNRLR